MMVTDFSCNKVCKKIFSPTPSEFRFEINYQWFVFNIRTFLFLFSFLFIFFSSFNHSLICLGYESHEILGSDSKKTSLESDPNIIIQKFLVSDRGSTLVEKACPILYEAVKRVYPNTYKEFFDGWNIQEVIRFFNSYNHYFLKPKHFLSKSAKKKRVKSFSPIFAEIFSGVKMFEEASSYDSEAFFVSEFLLDPSFQFKTQSQELTTRHDGVVVSIKDKNIYVYKISEAKDGGKYRITQGHGVYERWQTEGLYIYDESFDPDRIFLVIDDNSSSSDGSEGDGGSSSNSNFYHKKRVLNIKEASFEDFQSITEVAGTNFKIENTTRVGFFGSFFDVSELVGSRDKLDEVGRQMVSILDKLEKHQPMLDMYSKLNQNLVESIIENLFSFVSEYQRLPSFVSSSMNEKLLRLSLYYILYISTPFSLDQKIHDEFYHRLYPLIIKQTIYAPNMRYLIGSMRDKKCSRWFQDKKNK